MVQGFSDLRPNDRITKHPLNARIGLMSSHKRNSHRSIPVVDLFAGPGGLGEGFAALRRNNRRAFRICLSVENNPIAYETLKLRSFFREFPSGKAPAAYYEFVQGKRSIKELYKKHPKQAKRASQVAWKATLGEISEKTVFSRIRRAVGKKKNWILLGGPPCQAYSLVGRARVGGIHNGDKRLTLFQEYLKVVAHLKPAVFVLENVKGLLSSKLDGNLILDGLLHDLQSPAIACSRNKVGRQRASNEPTYRLASLVVRAKRNGALTAPDYVIRSEDYGVPQARHRIVILGIRDDLALVKPAVLKKAGKSIPTREMLESLPRLRSGLSRDRDNDIVWKKVISGSRTSRWLQRMNSKEARAVASVIKATVKNIDLPENGRGHEFIKSTQRASYRPDWFYDKRLGGVCNHTTRSHILTDLHRYLFAACYAKANLVSPSLTKFPKELLPRHKNVKKALTDGHFADRFRVQVESRPATTITSHIARDGHYYIHYDPSQCRSLTVREAARIQTFPDNYFFCGHRTAQYAQVGNAVPPLLAYQIAEIVYDLLK